MFSGGIMKKLSIVSIFVFVSIALVAFQNCSEGQFETLSSSSTEELETTVEDINSGKVVRDSKFIRVCPMVMCAAPPENCRYVHDSDENNIKKSFCSHGCGRLVCDRQPPIIEPPIEPINPPGVTPPVSCPMIACAHEEGCKFAGSPTLDKNECPIDCGQRVCDTRLVRKPPYKVCPAIAIACLDYLPGPNCTLDHTKTRDENGCVIRCPTPVCKNLRD